MSDLDALVSTVLASPKQRTIAPDLVRWIGAGELSKGRTLKDAVKATKNKLHQLAGAYQRERPNYAAWLATLQQIVAEGGDPRPFCTQLLAHHASTRERLPILHHFYATLFAGLPSITTILDLACGLNPLTAPWMELAPSATYHACDIYHDQMDFLGAALPLLGVTADASVGNLLNAPPRVAADVALLLKTLPCLEQADATVSARLLDAIDAPVLMVSFPMHSLGGCNKGMATHYAARFAELTQGKPWRIERFDFASELVYRIVR